MSNKPLYPKTISLGSVEWWKHQVFNLLLFIVFFTLCRLVFILRNFDFSEYTLIEILSTFYYGFRLDLSITAYTSIVLVIFSLFLFGNRACFLIYRTIYTIVIIILLLITIIDAELYTYWGFKIDSSVIKYLKTPKEAVASLSTLKLIGFVVLISLIITVVVIVVKKTMPRIKLTFNRFWQLNAILVLPIYFLFARGSVDVSGVNVSSAYFSQKQELNHAAINSSWNFMSTLFFPENKKAVEWNDSLSHYLDRFVYSCNSVEKVFKTNKTNVILVILESFTANLFDYEVDSQSSIPNLKRIASEGYFFPNCYATGNRSDKGLSAIFSGITAHPQGSIMQFPEKFSKIGRLVSHFTEAGYSTRFYYGGNSDFANFKGFLINNGFEKIIEQSNFPHSMRTSKWGVQDDIVVERFFNDIAAAREPFFYSIFTLSSHEPFEVPYTSNFYNETTMGKYLNSIAFTDSVLGSFYDQLKNTKLWENSLLIIVADHGHYLPINASQNEPAHYRIPLIFSGGALYPEYRNKINFSNISQTDIPNSLLRQFKMRDTLLEGGNNFFCEDFSAPVVFVFNFGYGVITPSQDIIVYNADAERLTKCTCKDTTFVNASNAWFRYKMQIYSKKK
ncbi:MAG TPA: sulfatase-like hydrolase/transferase [Salinivirgaceae bacterium]|nr:sulfatase-like hydrolase/transferase [Salinivirgaceae bacterium]